jgi:hypothetical protein
MSGDTDMFALLWTRAPVFSDNPCNKNLNLPNDFGKSWRKLWGDMAAGGAGVARVPLTTTANWIFGSWNENGG